jgi:NitT/TauT family transport system substrate-binding protein
MKRLLAILTLVYTGFAGAAQAQVETLRVGWCARTVSSAATPFAVATKMGWFEKAGVKIELVPLPGSGDCTKLVATGEIPFALPSAEPVLVIRPQGADVKFFYTAYQGNIYGFAVTEDSPLKSVADLKGKKIGVIGMGSAGAIVARALVSDAGMDPTKDVSIVVAGEGGQTAALLSAKQVDALSQFDTQYALVENAGVKLRYFDHPEIAKFPSNGFIALGDTLKAKRKQAIALAKGYAMGTAFAMANPEAAIRILWEVYPQTKATGKDEATAMRDDIATLNARAKSWAYEKVGAKRWGDNVTENYSTYIDWLLKNGVIKQKIPVGDMVVNDLLDEINTFDTAAIVAEAKAIKSK